MEEKKGLLAWVQAHWNELIKVGQTLVDAYTKRGVVALVRKHLLFDEIGADLPDALRNERICPGGCV